MSGLIFLPIRVVGIQDETDNDEMIYSRYESWRNLLWDSAAIESDLSDARYMFRVKWVDMDAEIVIDGRKRTIEVTE